MKTIYNQFEIWKKQNILLTITAINPGHSKRIQLHGRVIRYDIATESVLVYEDDEKKTYQFDLVQLEEIVPFKKS